MDKAYLDGFLSENEQLALLQFNSSEVMREAVRKVLTAGVAQHGTFRPNEPFNPRYNWALNLISNRNDVTDEELAQHIRTTFLAMNVISSSFDAMSVYQPEQPKVGDKKNNAR